MSSAGKNNTNRKARTASNIQSISKKRDKFQDFFGSDVLELLSRDHNLTTLVQQYYRKFGWTL